MKNSISKKWEFLHSEEVLSEEDIVDVLLENRGFKTKKEKFEFLNPKSPFDIKVSEIGIDEVALRKSIKRIKKAIEKNEKILIYGDYDADGVCATAIMWETLYKYTKNVLPHIPNRFSEGYGINIESISSLKKENPDISLIITVDNGIVANEAIRQACNLGIDVILTDHHQIGEALPNAYSIVHTDKISGAGVSWIFCREFLKSYSDKDLDFASSTLDLCAIGTISDQMPLVFANRSFAKYGIERINNTKRLGLNALFETASLFKGRIGTYEVNFQIAPRINATGRLDSAMDSLRLVCAKNPKKASELAILLNKANSERQRILDEVLGLAKREVESRQWESVIVVAHESFHEGVIGLAASKIVEQYYLPTIVISKTDTISKASARSISGFNIIESIQAHSDLILGGGGHPMAAGFSIETSKIGQFTERISSFSRDKITDEMKVRKLRIDLAIKISQITQSLYDRLKSFEPVGVANPNPTFVTKNLKVREIRNIGDNGKHIKIFLSDEDGNLISAIGFNMSYLKLEVRDSIDIAYTIEANTWNGQTTLELNLRDIKKNE